MLWFCYLSLIATMIFPGAFSRYPYVPPEDERIIETQASDTETGDAQIKVTQAPDTGTQEGQAKETQAPDTGTQEGQAKETQAPDTGTQEAQTAGPAPSQGMTSGERESFCNTL